MKKLIIKILIPFLVIGSGVGFYYYKINNEKPYKDNFTVETGELIRKVSVSGEVTAKEKVNLSFETNGTIESIFVEEGQDIKKGDEVAKLENQELNSQLQEALSNLSSARAQLNQKQSALETRQAELEDLKKGAQQEEVNQAQTEVTNAQKSLEDSKKKLDTTKQKAAADLQSDYISALSASQKAVSVAKNTIITITELQYEYFNQSSQQGSRIGEAKGTAVKSLLGADNAGWWREESISTLTGGAFGEVQKAIDTQDREDINKAINDLISALQDVNNLLEKIPITEDFSSSDKTTLATEKNEVRSEIENMLNKKDAIGSQKANNQSNITAVESEITQAENNLRSAEQSLSVLLAGTSKEKIEAKERQVSEAEAAVESQRAAIQQASANVNRIRSQLDKTIIKSSIDGLVSKVYPEVGETVSAKENIATIITPTKQIEADVSELDISNIKIGDKANITLDAFDGQTMFNAEVASIDSAETVINNVPTYGVELQFTQKYEQVKPGMTANIEIITDRTTSTLYLPGRAVQGVNGDTFVYVLEEGQINKKNITTSMRSTDGNIEIISGLKEGDTVVTGVKQ